MKTEQVEESLLSRVSPFVSFAALLGIPTGGFFALALLFQIPRLLYGAANPLLAAAGFGGFVLLFVMVLLLRACLKFPSAPTGFYRDVLDFLALARWHPSVKIGLIGLLVLPGAWYLSHSTLLWLFATLWKFGHNVFRSGDFRDELDRLATVYELALVGGVPLLFVLHMVSRWKPRSRVLPWLLVPALFVGTAIAVVIIGVILH
jgi:hypothetical protein